MHRQCEKDLMGHPSASVLRQLPIWERTGDMKAVDDHIVDET
jgi:hypothetical protein